MAPCFFRTLGQRRFCRAGSITLRPCRGRDEIRLLHNDAERAAGRLTVYMQLARVRQEGVARLRLIFTNDVARILVAEFYNTGHASLCIERLFVAPEVSVRHAEPPHDLRHKPRRTDEQVGQIGQE